MRSTQIFRVSTSAVIVALILAACGSSKDTEASPTDPPATTSVTTVAPDTTEAAVDPTGPALTAADLVLRADGLGPLNFGDAADSTIAALASALGTPTDDLGTEYAISCSSNPDECSGYADGYTASGTFSFGYPVGRSVCFGNGLCALFGGQTADELSFVGWTLGGPNDVNGSAPALLTADAITIGSIWADFENVISVSSGCFYTAYGETAGIRLQLSATTGDLYAPPGFTDSTDVFVQPGPEVMAVDYLSAGEAERPLIGDCPG